MSLGGRVDEIDVQVDKLHRLILGASKDDPELAAGCATSEQLSSVQNRLQVSAAACEALVAHLKEVLRLRSK